MRKGDVASCLQLQRECECEKATADEEFGETEKKILALKQKSLPRTRAYRNLPEPSKPTLVSSLSKRFSEFCGMSKKSDLHRLSSESEWLACKNEERFSKRTIQRSPAVTRQRKSKCPVTSAAAAPLKKQHSTYTISYVSPASSS